VNLQIANLKSTILRSGNESDEGQQAIQALNEIAADNPRYADAQFVLRELFGEKTESKPTSELSEAELSEKFRLWSVQEGRKYFQKLFPCPHSLTEQDERFLRIKAYFGPRVQAAERAGDESLRKKLVMWTSWATLDAVM
jgi:hypothetical protein